ncbi:MAG: prephenate dehydrogenase [Lachnospiraceae bacterium]|jgi:prephenate dehydrogenase
MNTLSIENPNLSFGFIGFGLIGGSVARCLRLLYPKSRILVMNRTMPHVEPALKDGTADFATDKIDESFRECDVIFICTPVARTEGCLKQLAPLIKPESIITDVGSVKGAVCRCAKDLGLETIFIGGHPMAGSERSGYANSSAQLLKNKPYVLTPFAMTPKEKLGFMKELVKRMGSRVITLSPEEHDMAVAGISHLPHLAAAALVRTVMDSDTKSKTMFALASSGFLDTTRVAASSSEMWEQIVQLNPEAVSHMLTLYIDSLSRLRDAIRDGRYEEVGKLFDTVRPYRESLDRR